jgi:hypothetical protein
MAADIDGHTSTTFTLRSDSGEIEVQDDGEYARSMAVIKHVIIKSMARNADYDERSIASDDDRRQPK